MPDWRDEIITALEFWIGLQGGTAGAPRWAPIGQVRPEAQRGWYALDVRGSKLNADQLDEPRIAGKNVAPEDGYPVLDVIQDGQLIRLQVPEFVDLREAYLWHRQQPKTYLTVKLREGIAAMGDAGLGHDLAAGRLANAPTTLPELAGFAEEQREAYASCFAPGVRLVWGPPGTGKTRVLTEAISTLMQTGKRVLLVSSTNIAVDNALLGVVRQRRHRPGTLLRVGPAHLPEIAADNEVSLPHLVRRQLAAIEEERAAVQAQILAISEAHATLAAAEEMLAGFEPERYARIRSLIQEAERIPVLAKAASEAQARRAEHQRRVTDGKNALQVAEDAWREANHARTVYAETDRLTDELRQVAAAADEVAVQALLARQQRDAIKQELAGLDVVGLRQRLANRGAA